MEDVQSTQAVHSQKRRDGKNTHVISVIGFILSVKKILAVINATYAVAKRKPEKIRLAGIRTLTSAIPVQRSNQLS